MVIIVLALCITQILTLMVLVKSLNHTQPSISETSKPPSPEEPGIITKTFEGGKTIIKRFIPDSVLQSKLAQENQEKSQEVIYDMFGGSHVEDVESPTT